MVKEMPDKGVTDLAKVMGAEWKKLSDREKAQWKAKSVAQVEAYKKQVAAWTSKYGPIPKKQKRVPKADKAPPRPGNAFSLFVKAKAKATMAELKTTKATEAITKLSRTWKQMTDAQKAPYVKEAAAAREAYAAAHPPAPTRPGNAYSYFTKAKAKAIMEQFRTNNPTDVSKELSRQWKTLTAAQKSVYVKEAAAAKAAYAAANPPAPVAAKASPPKAKAKAKAKAEAKPKGKAKAAAPKGKKA